jgi:hypothetical protein
MQAWFPFKEPVVLLLHIMGLSERSPKRILFAGPRRVRFSGDSSGSCIGFQEVRYSMSRSAVLRQ